MSCNKLIQRAVRRALLTGIAAGLAAPVVGHAQDQQIQEVVVTGSRIAKRDAVADTPILTVDQEAMADSGHTTVDHYLNTLPQIAPSFGSQSNNPSQNGRAHIDLRGLGVNRNLVLINGRRGMGSGIQNGGAVVDVNTIPAALIERVELITGGAAATYGPDAIAGVTNFILKNSFDGFAVNSKYNITEENDGQEWGADATFGGQFAEGRGNAVFNISYFKRDAIYKGAREFAAHAANTTVAFPNGSWTTGTNTPSATAVGASFSAPCAANGGSAGFGFNPDGSLFCTGAPGYGIVDYRGPASDKARAFDVFSYEFEPDNILVLPMERWSLYSNFDLELNDHFKPYATVQFTNYNAMQELAPTPANGTTGFTIPVTNPFVQSNAQLMALLASRANPNAPFAFNKRFNALGGRTGYNTHDVWNATLGAKGDIAGSWEYDFYAAYGRSVQNEAQGGNVRRDRVQALLNAADGGASVCEGGLNLIGAAPISKSCADYISLEAKNLTTVEQNIVEGVATGGLFDLPAGEVRAAIGASYRDLMLDFRPDSGLQPGLVAGFNQQLPMSGSLNFTDVFAEVSVPLLSELPYMQSLALTLGARTTDSNVTGSDETWKSTLDWTVNSWVRMRTGFQHAVRSPNINELYAPEVNNFPTFTNQDPCNTSGPIAASFRNGPNAAQVRALCAAQSAVAGGAGYVQPTGQANGLTGGNPDLKPEQADSFTFGVVLNSPWDSSAALERLTLSIDYWSIDLEDVILPLEAATIVQRCFNLDGANPTYDVNNSWCQMFARDQGNGGVIELEQFSENQALIKTSGIDVALSWGTGLGGFGNLDFTLVGTWLDKFEQQTDKDSPAFDYAGSIGVLTGQSLPEWKGTLVTSYSYGDLHVQATTRYIGSMQHRNVVNGGSPISNTGVPDTWYVDLSARYELTEAVRLRAGVSNLTNQQPRLYVPNVQSNTDPGLYDVLGRGYFVGVEMRM